VKDGEVARPAGRNEMHRELVEADAYHDVIPRDSIVSSTGKLLQIEASIN
jgi:hypothetical protein